VRRHVRALGHVAHVAQVTLVDDLAVILLGYAVDLHGLTAVHQIKESRECGAEIHAAAAAMADLEHALELFVEPRLVVEIRGFPVEGMPGGSLQAPFTDGHTRP
jgi:hypothetical protein